MKSYQCLGLIYYGDSLFTNSQYFYKTLVMGIAVARLETVCWNDVIIELLIIN